ncbi:MAG: hypothetical protein JKX71_02480, partial [Amylibacter sp.]|nr:hypothetical protein [Amylibacter sp.]
MVKPLFEIPTETLVKGPVGFIFAEDLTGLSSSIRHHVRLGFKNLFVLKRQDLELPESCVDLCQTVDIPDAFFSDVSPYVNQLIASFPDRWIYYCFNAEYLHFPFCENRSIEDLTDFITEEKRASVFTYTIDLYADDLSKAKDGFSLEGAHFDGAGYYALQRFVEGEAQDRQLDIYGGLKWRFEEHLPYEKRRLNRVSLFKPEAGLEMDAAGYFNNPEYNTFACPWHHNTTITICSFRTAKSLKTNPGSTFEIDSFVWSKSVKFRWNSQQLMDHGFMEPGQWF